MNIFLITFTIFLLAVLALSLGWLFGQRTLKGSCGGLAAISGVDKSDCVCSNPCEKRLKQLAQAQKIDEQTIINRLPD